MNSQVNLRLPADLRRRVEKYMRKHGFSSMQDLAKEALREKIMEEDSIRETLEIMGDKKLMASLRRSIEDFKKGRFIEFGSMKELRKRYK